MGKEVKNVFAPEFINCLTGTVVFNSLSREIERTVTGRVKPLLVHEILFGALKNGGNAVLDADRKEFSMKVGRKSEAEK